MRTSTRRWTGWGGGLPKERRAWALGATLLAGALVVVGATAPWNAARAAAATPVARTLAAASLPATKVPSPIERPALGEDLVELGRRLFFDPGASHSKRVACASCHDPEHGYSDPQVVSSDDFGATARHSQPLLGLGLASPLHWDGEFASIEDLVSARTGDVRSRAGGGYRGEGQPPDVLMKVTPVAESLATAGLYAGAFEAAFGDPKPTRERLSMALAWYVRSLQAEPSAYDRYAAGDESALSPDATRGLELFKGRAGCAQCHTVEGDRPAFTDHAFHNTGIAKAPAGRGRRGRGQMVGLDEGRGRFSKRDGAVRSFKTPSLRDVALRAPYMHDGSFATLESVVRYYALECGTSGDDRMDARLTPFAAGRPAPEVDQDVTDLVAFLVALTGETRAGLAKSAWSHRPETMRLRFLQKDGKPYRGAVVLTPAGDPLPSDASASSPRSFAPRHATPDAEGWVTVAPPPATHFEVGLPGSNLRPASGDLVPDTCREAVLTLEPGGSLGMVRGTGGGMRQSRIR
jgi:cytochrome c peroxidase